MKIEVVQKVLKHNEQAARDNRTRLDAAGICCVNILGGAGCGKTSLLEALVPRLRERFRIAVLEGDLETTRDAERIAALNTPVVQLLTGGGCHLNATQVQEGLNRLPLGELDLIFIENVGNPICPAGFDLGEHLRLAVLSVAEGHDKLAKYPPLFRDADAVVLSKCDLLELADFDPGVLEQDLGRLNPRAPLFRTSVRSGEGFAELAGWVTQRVGCGGERPADSRRRRG